MDHQHALCTYQVDHDLKRHSIVTFTKCIMMLCSGFFLGRGTWQGLPNGQVPNLPQSAFRRVDHLAELLTQVMDSSGCALDLYSEIALRLAQRLVIVAAHRLSLRATSQSGLAGSEASTCICSVCCSLHGTTSSCLQPARPMPIL